MRTDNEETFQQRHPTTELPSRLRYLAGKKCFLSGIEGGGEDPARIKKNIIYILIFDGRKRCTSCPKEGEGGGEVIRAMPERKHLFVKEVFPLAF